MSANLVEKYTYAPIRSVKVVVDLEDSLSPELTLQEFMKNNGAYPSTPRYRILELELTVCPEDRQPVLVTECGRCPKFVKRLRRHICCRKAML